MPHKDPAVRRAYMREYAKKNRDKVARWARNCMERMRAENGKSWALYQAKLLRTRTKNRLKINERQRIAKAKLRAMQPPKPRKEKRDLVDSRKKHFEKNKHVIQQKRRERYAQDPKFRIAYNLRNRLRMALKRNSKCGSAVSDLGCSVSQLMTHLEGQFSSGMSWENYGKWHIDHIIPLAKFDLTHRSEVLRACHFTNLQPLWAKDNIGKGARIALMARTSYNEVVPLLGQRLSGARTDSAMTANYVMEKCRDVRTESTAPA